MPGEAGRYELGADHPGVSAWAVQDSLTLLGVRATPRDNVLRIAEGKAFTSSIQIENLSDLPLSQLAATVIEKPENVLVTLALRDTTLPGSGKTALELTATARDTSITQGGVIVRLSNPDGVTAEVRLPVVVELLQPRLAAEPASLLVGMKRGAQSTVQFKLTNTGGAPSGELKVLPPALPWLGVASGGRLASLAPATETTVTLVLTPPADLALGEHQGSIVIAGEATSLSVPFNFRSLSEAVGDLKISAVDEYTYYAEGSPPVANASVTVTDELTGKAVASGLTDARGELVLRNLTEAYYRIEVRAEGHATHRSTTLVQAGKTNDLLAFLNRETVKYIFTVVPTEIEDRTRIVIETVFETVVPIPVITVEPMLIDLADFKEEVMQVDLKITNHGLIAAEDVRVSFPEHPDISAKPLVDQLGTLAAKSSVTVPLVIRRLKPAVGLASAGPSTAASLASSAGGGCDLRGDTLYNLICGPVKRGYGVPVMLTNAKSGCGGGGRGPFEGGGFGGFFGGGGGQGFSGGGAIGAGVYSGPLPTTREPSCCALFTLAAAVKCGLPIAGDIFEDPSNKFETDPLVQRIIDGVGNIQDAQSVIDALSGSSASSPALQSVARREPSAAGLVIVPKIDPEKAFEIAEKILEGLEKAGVEAAKKYITPVKMLSCAYSIATACNSSSLALATSGSPPRSTTAGLASAPRPTSLGVEPIIRYTDRLQKLVDARSYPFGSDLWLQDESSDGPKWLRSFLERARTTSREGRLISSAERSEMLVMALPSTVNLSLAGRFLERWNRTVNYWSAGRFNLTQVPAGESTDFIAIDVWRTKLSAAGEAIDLTAKDGFLSVSEALDSARKDLIRTLRGQGLVPPQNVAQSDNSRVLQGVKHSAEGEICATIRLRIEQQAVITRDAFDAGLEISNSTDGPLEEVFVELEMRNQAGETTMGLFGIRPATLSGLSGVDGTGVIGAHSSGKASWILIPTALAAPEGPTLMLVGGTLRYRQQATLITIPLAPATITVLPNASLKVKYFHDRDIFSDDPFTDEIEPAVPFSLGVLIQNSGKGAARNVRISSAQPKIVENEKGLLIDFEILATEVAGLILSPSLTASFGNIAPGEVAQGRWLLRSSLQGLFTEYQASFEHLDSLGDKRLSLIESVEIHELNHVVRSDRAADDGKLDFLANDVADLRDLPDTLHLIDGKIAPVSVVERASVDAAPSAGDLEVKLTALLPAGWVYLRIPDPADGRFRLRRALRADGTELPLDFNIWTTDRTFVGGGRRPIREHVLHLLDHDSQGSYTLFYFEPEAPDRTAPSSKVEAPPTTPDAQTVVSLANTAPTISVPSLFTLNEGEALSLAVQGTDADAPADALTYSLDSGTPTGAVIDPNSGLLTWVTGEGSGPSTNKMTVRVTDHGAPSLSATGTLTVLVREVNQAPEITAVPDRTINEGSRLTFTATASDPDLPTNLLSFRLGPGAPVGASITPAGVFSWTPTALQGPSTNSIPITVTDNGTPSRTVTTAFRVIVRDALGDFILGLGSTNVLAGQRGDLPIQISSGVDLIRATFRIESPGGLLRNLNLKPLVPELSLASLHAQSPTQFQIDLTCGAGQVLQGNQAVAQLSFEAESAGESALVPVQIVQLVGERTSGAKLTQATARPGRVTIVGRQPILEAIPGPSPALVLYGRPGASFAIELTRELKPAGPWTVLTRVPQTATFQSIGNLPAGQATIFYRAVEFVARPAMIEVPRGANEAGSLLVFGEAGRAYELQALTELSGPGTWAPQGTIVLTNSFRFLDAPERSAASGFYRVQEK